MSKDKDQRIVASHILKTANTVVTTERGNQHGGAEDSFAMIAKLWQTYLNNSNKHEAFVGVDVTAYDVAQMMTLLKVARAVHGNPLNEDNYVDAAGYQSLAASIAGVKVPTGEISTAAMVQVANELAKEFKKPAFEKLGTAKTIEPNKDQPING